QIRPGAEARLRSEPAEEDVPVDVGGKGPGRLACAPAGSRRPRGYRPDRGRRTGDKRHKCAMNSLGRGRLAADARLVAVIAEGLGRDLPAGVAVDARVIDVELALDVLRQPMFELRHQCSSPQPL